MSSRPTARLTAALVARHRDGASAPADGVEPDLLRPKPGASCDPRPGRTAEVRPLRNPRPAKGAARSGRQATVRIGVRLDVERHLQLKMLAAREEQTQQGVLIRALDEYLARHAPDVRENLHFGRK